MRDTHPLSYFENNYNQGVIDTKDVVDTYRTKYGNLRVKNQEGKWADVHPWLGCEDGRALYGVRYWIDWVLEDCPLQGHPWLNGGANG